MVRVYVEANFVLDVAYQRDRNSQQLLELARVGRVQLAIPYTALWEANSAVARDAGRWKEFADTCRRVANELEPLEAAKQAVTALRDAATPVEDFAKLAGGLVAETYGSMRAVARVIPFTPAIHTGAVIRALQHLLEERDAMVLDAIIGDVTSDPVPWSCLYTTNERHFGKDSVIRVLKSSGVSEIYFRAGDVVRAVLEGC